MAITIKIKEHGPYLIAVEDAPFVTIVDAAGWRYEPTPGKAIALCRCGHSSRKPFCDGTHRTIGFHGVLTAPRTPVAGDPPAATSAVTADAPGPAEAASRPAST